MRFEDCRPFIRYARELTVSQESAWGTSVPYDARLFYARSGEGEILVGGRPYPMREGSVLYLPPATVYRLVSPPESVTYFALNFDLTMSARTQTVPVPPDPPEDFRREGILCPAQPTDAPELSAPLYLTGMLMLEPSLTSISGEFQKKMIFCDARMSAVLFKVLTDCVRRARVAGNATRRREGSEILDYIQEHYREELSNESIGARFGFHKNYVSDLIKTATGRPLHQYLLYVRLSHAWEMLEAGEMSIAQIAGACGFADMCYFSRYFKQVYGHAPSYFRTRTAGL